jgi:RNA polymerase sigma factor (sigma-70 family)
MPLVTIPHRASGPRLGAKRLLALASDSRLVDQMRRGSESAFEVAFERHGASILGFCRHLLGSAEEAEDAVQHTFAAAWRDLSRDDRREVVLRPWLFTIARNRCLSILRSRRERHELPELATGGLTEEVERRMELRELLRDIGELPDEQRDALLLSETGDLSHAEIARVLGCETARVKSLVFRARSTLIARRGARAAPCEEIREQLASARGGALRRTELRLHLKECPGCRSYRDEVRRQRQLLAAALPLVPAGLKSSVLAAAGIGGGGAAVGGTAAGAAATGAIGATFGVAGSELLAKLAVVGVLAGGGVVAGTTLVDELPEAAPPERSALDEGGRPAVASPVDRTGETSSERSRAAAPRQTGNGGEIRARRGTDGTRSGTEAAKPPSPTPGHEKQTMRDRKTHAPRARGRGPEEAPPASVPVKRGPGKTKAPHASKPAPGPKPKPAPGLKPKPAPEVKPKPAPGPKPKAITKTKVASPPPHVPSAVSTAPAAPPKKVGPKSGGPHAADG